MWKLGKEWADVLGEKNAMTTGTSPKRFSFGRNLDLQAIFCNRYATRVPAAANLQNRQNLPGPHRCPRRFLNSLIRTAHRGG